MHPSYVSLTTVGLHSSTKPLMQGGVKHYAIGTLQVGTLQANNCTPAV